MSAVDANEQTMEHIDLILNIHYSFKQAIGSIGVSHNAYSVVFKVKDMDVTGFIWNTHQAFGS